MKLSPNGETIRKVVSSGMPYKNKQQQKEFQKNYRKDKPKSAISKHYSFYLFVRELDENELRFLFTKKKNECKGNTNEEIERLRTEMSIIRDVYRKLKNNEIDYDLEIKYVIVDRYNDQNDW